MTDPARANWEEEVGWKYYFPYEEIRDPQKEIIEDAFQFLEGGGHYVLNAANGIGKTVSALCITLPLAKKYNLKVLYLCRTYEQMDRVIEEAKLIDKKAPTSCLSIRSRSTMCINKDVLSLTKDPAELTDICNHLKQKKKCGYYTNFLEKSEMVDLLVHEPLTASELVERAQHYEVCPAELSRSLISSSTLIVANYLYLLNPHIRSSFLHYLGMDDLSKCIVVFDEVHNLIEAAISATSFSLTLFSINQAISEAKKYQEAWAESYLQSINDALLGISKTIFQKNDEVELSLAELDNALNSSYGARITREELSELKRSTTRILSSMDKEGTINLRSYVNSVLSFLEQWLTISEKSEYASFFKKDFLKERGNTLRLRLELIPLDSYEIIEEITRTCFGTLNMSGTLEPIDMYVERLGLRRRPHRALNVTSPYTHMNVLTLISDELSTQFTRRSPTMFENMVKVIHTIIQNTPKNVGIFTSSYQISGMLVNAGLLQLKEKPFYYITRNLSASESDEQVAAFKRQAEGDGGVLLAVLGGRSSEGSDFPNDLMNCVIIVGLPFAPPSARINRSIQYAREKYGNVGRDYAYVLPAMTRAAQATGRPFRSPTDRAIVVLMDDRYARPEYRRYFPKWIMEHSQVVPLDTEYYKFEFLDFFDLIMENNPQ